MKKPADQTDDAANISRAIEALFTDLPTQNPPTIIAADNHVLVRCDRCAGRGTEKCPYPRSHPRWVNWDKTCWGCDGHGWKLERW